ncbi:uncharacterized protein LOC130989445 [Salvia miltiorrhiza]|uniref:uncharacterized protein LOC130989445 n=1 Tax=Salvia miltiorrhiza TaxID=226208 RepID=UPI0025AD04CD|nr:uncharacterized protein LOC130989445 [Salvia miltiorrhiza]
MGVVLRYVNDKGCVIERFIGIVHVVDTCSHSLKDALSALFVKHGLSLSKLRGQGYDGTSNMRATASVERAFSAMKLVKSDLRNRMQDEWMNDSLIVYIENDIFSTIDNEKILQRFQSMSTRRNQLSSLSQTETTTSPSIYS